MLLLKFILSKLVAYASFLGFVFFLLVALFQWSENSPAIEIWGPIILAVLILGLGFYLIDKLRVDDE